MEMHEFLINNLQSRIKLLEDTVNLLKDYNESLKERDNDLKMQIIELKSGHFCCLEPHCPNQVVQRIFLVKSLYEGFFGVFLFWFSFFAEKIHFFCVFFVRIK